MKLISKRDINNSKEDVVKVQVISETGENLGIMSLDIAFDLATSKSLDLAMVSEGKEKNPTAKLLDYSKKMYNEKKKRAIVLFFGHALKVHTQCAFRREGYRTGFTPLQGLQ